MRHGNIAEEITRCAAERAGLVVMGLRSRKRGKPGAIAARVLHKQATRLCSRCPTRRIKRADLAAREVIFDERLVDRKRRLRSFGSSHDGELHKTGGVARHVETGDVRRLYVPVFTAPLRVNVQPSDAGRSHP